VEEAFVVSIIGANGAGKSTLLNTIAGVRKPSQGSIDFHGKKITGLTPIGRWWKASAWCRREKDLPTADGAGESRDRIVYVQGAEKQRVILKKIYDLFPVLEERRNQLGSTLSGESSRCSPSAGL